jgi:hypothetical protein
MFKNSIIKDFTAFLKLRRLVAKLAKDAGSGPSNRFAKCYICTVTMLNSDQFVTPSLLERISNQSGRNRLFRTLNVLPMPLLSAEVTTNTEVDIIRELKEMLQEAEFRIVALVADVMTGSFGGKDRMEFGIIGKPVETLLKATLSLPNANSWMTRDVADAIGCPTDAEQSVGETSFFQVDECK